MCGLVGDQGAFHATARQQKRLGRYRTTLSRWETSACWKGIALRQRQLSADQYVIVDVRTSRGVLRSALLIP
jgi:hypothetical protein